MVIWMRRKAATPSCGASCKWRINEGPGLLGRLLSISILDGRDSLGPGMTRGRVPVRSGLVFLSVVCSSRGGRFETAALAQSFKVQGELPAVGSMALLQCSQQMALHLLRA